MGSAFVSPQTYTRTIGETPDAHGYVEGVDPFQVELRPLDAGDRAKIRDALALEREDGATGLALGTLELLHVRQAVVSWTLPAAPTPATIGRLRPDVLEAIRELVSWGVEQEHATKAEGDAAPAPSAEAREAAERQRVELEADELRDGEPEGRVPLASSAGGAGDGC
jgi:hypothetical protein